MCLFRVCIIFLIPPPPPLCGPFLFIFSQEEAFSQLESKADGAESERASLAAAIEMVQEERDALR